MKLLQQNFWQILPKVCHFWTTIDSKRNLYYIKLVNTITKIKNLRVLVLEDDEIFQRVIAREFKTLGMRTVKFTKSIKEFENLIEMNEFDLAYLDVYLEEKPDGVKALNMCKDKGINAYMLSASDDETIIETTIKNSCIAFLNKSHIKENIHESLIDYVESKSGSFDNKVDQLLSDQWLTADFELIEQIKKLMKINWQKLPILITGETGVGKTTLLKSLHRIKHGEESPYVEFNSGGKEKDSTITDVELFGVKKGAYTGADIDRKGKFDHADSGTLFFDEIGNISISTQEKLIKSIDEKTYSPVGSQEVKSVNSAFAFATLKNLDELVESGKMKKDFHARLSGYQLEIKPLRERRDDIILIIHRLMKNQKRKFIITKEAKNLIYKYDWPYNVRELISEFENWKIEASDNGNILDKEQLSTKIKTNYNPFKKRKGKSVLSQAALNFIKKHGYQEAIESFNNELISVIKDDPNFFNISKDNYSQVEKQVGIPRRTYKKLLDHYESNYAK